MPLPYILVATSSSVKNIKGAALALDIIGLIVGAILIVSLWQIFKKAKRPSWAAIVPFYSSYVLFEISGLSGWLGVIGALLIYFADGVKSVPILVLAVGAYAILYVVAAVNLSKRFNKSIYFAIYGLTILPFIGYPMLAFSSAKYKPIKNKDITA